VDTWHPIMAVAIRREAGFTQHDVADLMGRTQQAVQKLERYDADPQLSTLRRRYANAVGAIVTHEVRRDDALDRVISYGERSSTSAMSTRAALQAPLFVRGHKGATVWVAPSKRTDFTLTA